MSAMSMPGYDTWLLPPDDGPEPSLNNISDALDKLVADTDRLREFCVEDGPDFTTVFQLYHARGLPRMDKSKRDDELRDLYSAAFDAVLVAYRDSLGDKLDEAARVEMEAEAERSRQDAAEAYAESRADY